MFLDVDGASVHALTGGSDFDSSKPAVVFLHGAGTADHMGFPLQAEALASAGIASNRTARLETRLLQWLQK